MVRFTSLPHRVLWRIALVYAVITVGFILIHIYHVRTAKSGNPGIEARYSPADHFFVVERVTAVSAAEQAGLRDGDRVVALNGQPVEPFSFYRLMMSTAAGENVEFPMDDSTVVVAQCKALSG